MVSPREKTCLLHPVVGRFATGNTIRVVQPAEVMIAQSPWVLEDNKSCGLRMTLTVRVCWRTAVYRDEVGYVESNFTY
jgi:hypothetical protein